MSSDDTEQPEIQAEMVAAPTHASDYHWWRANCPDCGQRFEMAMAMDAQREARNCCSVQTDTDQ